MRRAVGLFFFLGLIILGGLTFWVDDEMSFFRRSGSYYYITLSSADGLREGTAVSLAGFQVGRVTNVELRSEDGNVRVHFSVSSDSGCQLRVDTQASMPATSLLSNGRSLSLTMGSPEAALLPGKPEMPGTEIKNVKKVVSLEALIEKAEGLFSSLEEAGPAIKDAAVNIKDITAKIKNGQGTLGKLVNDSALYDELKTAASSLVSIANKIDKGQGTLGKLVNDEALYAEAKRFLTEAREAVEDAREQAPINAFGSLLFTAFQ